MPARLSRLLLALAAALLASACAVFPVASAADVEVGNALVASVSPSTSLLFVQGTEGGSIEPVARGRYRLKLTGVSRSVATFTDRPRRRAGQESLRGYVKRWARRGFASDPPNAALVVHGAPRGSDVVMLTLSKPRYHARADTLTYNARPLKGRGDDGLASLRRRADPPRARGFGAASVFVDAGESSVYKKAVLQVSNVSPGQRVSVEVEENGANIGWSMGPSLLASSAIQVVALSGEMPLSQVSVSSSEANFLTTASGGAAISFDVSLFLVAGPSIETFYMRSASDPGVEVQLQIGSAQPQVVNQTDTLFSWQL